MLLVGIHDNIKPIPDFAVRLKIFPSETMVSELSQILSEVLQIIKKNDASCINSSRNLQGWEIQIALSWSLERLWQRFLGVQFRQI